MGSLCVLAQHKSRSAEGFSICTYVKKRTLYPGRGGGGGVRAGKGCVGSKVPLASSMTGWVM